MKEKLTLTQTVDLRTLNDQYNYGMIKTLRVLEEVNFDFEEAEKVIILKIREENKRRK